MRNLRAEMTRYGITNHVIQEVLGCSLKTVLNKLTGNSEFSVGEAIRIRDSLFPGMRLEYLFQPDAKPTLHESTKIAGDT